MLDPSPNSVLCFVTPTAAAWWLEADLATDRDCSKPHVKKVGFHLALLLNRCLSRSFSSTWKTLVSDQIDGRLSLLRASMIRGGTIRRRSRSCLNILAQPLSGVELEENGSGSRLPLHQMVSILPLPSLLLWLFALKGVHRAGFPWFRTSTCSLLLSSSVMIIEIAIFYVSWCR